MSGALPQGRRAHRLAFAASLGFGAWAAIPAMRTAFSGPLVVQDDARQHVFWMQRFLDPELFPQDLIADYFASVAPLGFVALYRALAALGVPPELAAKLFPLLLSVATAGLAYALVAHLHPSPLAAFLSSFVLVQNLWLFDALSNATPRAFFYPLFLAALLGLVAGHAALAASASAALALFYPPGALLAAAVAGLWWVGLQDGRLTVAPKPERRVAFAAGMAAMIALVPFALGSGGHGPVLTAAEGAALPELAPGGRSAFFEATPAAFLLCGDRSGLVPLEWCWARRILAPGLPVALVGLGFAALLYAPRLLARGLSPALAPRPILFALFARVALASLLLFALAHLLLFRLHLPSRYGQHTLRILAAVALGSSAAMILGVLLRALVVRGLGQPWRWGLTAGALMVVLGAPFAAAEVAWHGYVVSAAPAVHAHLAGASKDALVASTEPEADNIPAFAGRSILVGQEYAVPWHADYHREIRARASDVLRAQYTGDPRQLREVIEGRGVTHWLLDEDAFSPGHVARHPWVRWLQPEGDHLARALAAGHRPALQVLAPQCTVLIDGELRLLDADCLAAAARRWRSGDEVGVMR